ncbi:MAG TPA: barstar family protein [Stellaceae bacterium]|nr:barstar family protein [Stellaceae bacterium]
MRLIELDAAGWRDVMDYYNALKRALGSPAWHGDSVDAWIDSMLYGGINRIDPPYVIRIAEVSKCPAELRCDIDQLAQVIREAREDQRQRYGKAADVAFEINP